MSIDFTLIPKQRRLRADVRAFARDALSKVQSAAKDLPTPLAPLHRYRTIPRTDRRSRLPAPPDSSTVQRSGRTDCGHGGAGRGVPHVDINISLTLLGTMLGLFPVLGDTPERASGISAAEWSRRDMLVHQGGWAGLRCRYWAERCLHRR